MTQPLHTIEKNSSNDLGLSKHFDTDSAAQLERLELMSALQSTLDLKTQLKLFLEKLRGKLKIDGLSFVDETRDLRLKIGKQSTHSCGYRLTHEGMQCGEISFRRSTRFTEEDLQIIEESMLILLVPVSNALKYTDAVSKAAHESSRKIVKRQTLTKALKREIELAKRHNHPLSLMTLKLVNEAESLQLDPDESTLEQLCHSLHAIGNNTDLWFRTGAAEFVLLTHGNIDVTKAIAKRLKNLEHSLWGDGHLNEDLSLRVGSAALTGTDSITSLLKRAQLSAYAEAS